MPINFTANEVFLVDVQDTINKESAVAKGEAYAISNNMLLFETPTKFVGKTIWKVKNNSTGKLCMAIFPGIDVDVSCEEIEVIHKGVLVGEDTAGKTPYLLVNGQGGGIQGMLFNAI